MDRSRIARDVTVRGQVQGVFFRDTTRRVARELGVAGWVRNAPDGSVRAHFEGEPAAVDQVVRFVRTGPPEASVDDVDEREADDEGLTSFEIR
jgi:acylphosphatase